MRLNGFFMGFTTKTDGFHRLFESYDGHYGEDGDVEIDLYEFSAIIRNGCNISEDIIGEDILSELFDEVDIDGTVAILE